MEMIFGQYPSTFVDYGEYPSEPGEYCTLGQYTKTPTKEPAGLLLLPKFAFLTGLLPKL